MTWVEGLLNNQDLLKWIIDVTLKGTLLLTIAAGITYLLRRASAAARHWVWSFGLFGVLLVPVLSMLLPNWNLPLLPEINAVEPVVQSQEEVTTSNAIQQDAVSHQPSSFLFFKQAFINPAIGSSTEAQTTANNIVQAQTPQTPQTSQNPQVRQKPQTPAVSQAPAETVIANQPAIASETVRVEATLSETIPVTRAPLKTDNMEQFSPEVISREVAVQPVMTPSPITPSDFLASFSSTQWILVGVLVWGIGFMFIMGRLLLGMLWIRWVSRKAETITDPYWTKLCDDICQRFEIDRPIRLWQGKHAATPMTWGVFKPVVLLPEEAGIWPEEKCRVVLMHELAHVKRKDTLTQMMAQIACALFWFNPLVWVAAYKMRVEREHACDDQVLQLGTLASDYAGHLLDIARSLRSARVASLATIAMARRSQLEGRLLAILNPRLNRRALSPILIGFIAIVMVVVMVPLAAIQPWAPGPNEDVALASVEDHNEAPDEFEPTLERPARPMVREDRFEAVPPEQPQDAIPAVPADNPQNVNVFVDVAQEINKLKHLTEGTGGGEVAAKDALDEQIVVLIDKVAILLKTTTTHLNALSELFASGQEGAREQAKIRLQSFSVAYKQIMTELEQALDNIEAIDPDFDVKSELKERFNTALEDDVNALTDAATGLVDSIDVYVEIILSKKLGFLGSALSDLIGIATDEVKVEIQLMLSEMFENLVILDRAAGNKVIIINPSSANISIDIDMDDVADEWKHLINGAKAFLKEFGHEINWPNSWDEEAFEAGMEAWEKQHEAEMEAWEEEFEADMEAWEEQFEADMEAWAEQFEADMEAWGEQLEADMEAWAEELEASLEENEEDSED